MATKMTRQILLKKRVNYRKDCCCSKWLCKDFLQNRPEQVRFLSWPKRKKAFWPKAFFLSFRNDGVDHLLFWLIKFVPVDELIYLNISVILCWLLFHFRWLLTPFGQGLLAMICYALSRQSLYYIFFPLFFWLYS